jgi:hypothetical protein
VRSHLHGRLSGSPMPMQRAHSLLSFKSPLMSSGSLSLSSDSGPGPCSLESSEECAACVPNQRVVRCGPHKKRGDGDSAPSPSLFRSKDAQRASAPMPMSVARSMTPSHTHPPPRDTPDDSSDFSSEGFLSCCQRSAGGSKSSREGSASTGAPAGSKSDSAEQLDFSGIEAGKRQSLPPSLSICHSCALDGLRGSLSSFSDTNAAHLTSEVSSNPALFFVCHLSFLCLFTLGLPSPH